MEASVRVVRDVAVQSYLRHMLVRTWSSVVLWGLAMVAVVALGRRFG